MTNYLTGVANFIFELAQLREKSRSGWELLKIPDKERVAPHVFRTAQLAYVLAIMEGHPDPNHVAMCGLFHENDETRLPDLNKVAARYVPDFDKGLVVRDQTAALCEAGERIYAFWNEVHERKTVAGVIAKDADYLECAFTAKEYAEQGHDFADDWMKNNRAALKTKSAQELFERMIIMDSNDWWQGLKKLT